MLLRLRLRLRQLGTKLKVLELLPLVSFVREGEGGG
jgi:hypothetical protein